MSRSCLLLCGLVLVATIAAVAPAADELEWFRESFDHLVESPILALSGSAGVADGRLRTTAVGHWQRGGLEVGPLALPEGIRLIVEYDFRPIRLGAQGQSFVSQTPSTHWYMFYADSSGRMRLHTRLAGKWEARAHSSARIEEGRWYRARVELGRQSVHFVITGLESGKLVWDTGPARMDDVGQATTCMLVDESGKPDDGATEWDNLRLAADDAVAAAACRENLSRLAEELRRRRQLQAEARAAAEDQERLGLALIPTPRKLRFGPGRFRIDGAAIACARGLEAEAEAVRMVMRERAGRELARAKGGRPGIALRQVESGPWPQPKTRPAEGYCLTVGAGGVRIEAQTRAGFLAAAWTLAQLARDRIEVPEVEVVDWPAIENRLVMIAVSQGGFQVIDVEYWKRIIGELAAVKINMIMPYFETGTFDYKKYPLLNVKGSDAFTAEKARLLSDYARARGVELLPQQQSLGHAGYLSLKELSHLAESPGVVCSSNPEVFEFLAGLYDELLAAFPDARSIHVGGDEFGHGFAKCPRCRARAAEIGKAGLYAEHMMHLRDILGKRNRKIMIWWNEQGLTEEAADRLAKDIAIFDWHYGNQRSYPSLERLAKLGFTSVWATPAVTRYYSAPNDFDNTFGNIRGFLTVAAERHLPGECTCTWCHGIWGGRNHFELNLYALLYSAQCAWSPEGSAENDFRRRFAQHWFGLEGKGLADEVLAAWHAPLGRAKEQLFWRDSRAAEPVLAAGPGETIAELEKAPQWPDEARRLLELCAGARKILSRWQASAKRNRATADFLLHDVHVYETLGRRILVLDTLARRWPEIRTAEPRRRKALVGPIVAELEALAADYREMERMFDRSILEAGGARCGKGSFSGGEICFRSQQGRAGIEKLTARLRSLDAPGALPQRIW